MAQLKKFELDSNDDLVFILAGGAKDVPVKSAAAGKGQRKVVLSTSDHEDLYALGEGLETDDTEVAAEASDIFQWFTEYFVTEGDDAGDNGDDEPEEEPEEPEEIDEADPLGIDDDEEPEPEPEPKPKAKAKKTAKPKAEKKAEVKATKPKAEKKPKAKPAPEPEPEPAPEEPADLATVLGKLSAAEVKGRVTDAGLKPEKSKAANIALLVAHAARFETALASVAAARSFISGASAEDLETLREMETAGKARKGILKSIDDAISLLTPEPEPEPEPVKAPKAKTTPLGKAKATKGKAKAAAPKATAKAPPKAKAAPKAKAKPKKEVKPLIDDDIEDTDEVQAMLMTIAPDLASLVQTVGQRRAKTIVTRMLGRIDPESGEVQDETYKPGVGALPLFHIVGRQMSITKRHRNGWGTCTYTVECEDAGRYKLVGFEGNRPALKKQVGKSFVNGTALLRALTDKEVPGTMVYRYFGLDK